jgi:hypothetical protein
LKPRTNIFVLCLITTDTDLSFTSALLFFQNLPHAYLAQTKIIATLGNESRSKEKIEELLQAGMSGKAPDCCEGARVG